MGVILDLRIAFMNLILPASVLRAALAATLLGNGVHGLPQRVDAHGPAMHPRRNNQQTLEDRAALVRYAWLDMSPNRSGWNSLFGRWRRDAVANWI